MNLSLKDLIDYTQWEREKWHAWLTQQGDHALTLSAGPHGDGRFETVGDLVRHIFSAEKRYVDRLSGRPLTDPASIPKGGIEALFQFGQQSREEFNAFLTSFAAKEWDVEREFKIASYSLRATPRKIIVHVVMHEIRHWAQIATVFRFNGLPCELHDFLFSPAMGGEFQQLPEKP